MANFNTVANGLIGSIKNITGDAGNYISNLLQSFGLIGSGGGQVYNPATQKKELYKTNYEDIIGLPPLAYLGDDETTERVMNKVLQSMIVLELIPGYPEYTGLQNNDMNIFKIDTAKGEEKFKAILKESGAEALTTPLKIAVQNDVSISESWSNEFGESRFEDMANVGSGLARELRYITGQDSLSGAIDSLNTSAIGAAASLGAGESITNMLSGLNDKVVGAGKAGEAFVGKSGIGKGLLQLASGSRVDFPMVWNGCGFSPSYSFTVRLYNPYPKDDNAYYKFILRPMANLLAFVIPIADSNFTMGFPIVCKVNCPGLFGLEAGYVSNIDIIKGGESNDISFRQRPGTVDVRLTLGSLYASMISKGEFNIVEDRPTLGTYINDMKGVAHINEEENIVTERDDNGVTTNSNSDPSAISVLSEVVRDGVALVNNISGILENPNRLTLETMEAFSDPIINGLSNITQTLTPLSIARVNTYKEEILNLVTNIRQLEDLPLEDRVAVKIKNQIPIPLELENWFWNNIDRFDDITRTLVQDIDMPSITPIISEAVDSISAVTSKVKTGSF